jgi:hypothetical protein
LDGLPQALPKPISRAPCPRETNWPHFSLPVAAHPGRSLMLQVFTGVSKVEKAQRISLSIEKFGQQSQQNKSPTK